MARQTLPRTRRRNRAMAAAVLRWACDGCGKSNNADDASNCGRCGRSWGRSS
ncbi:hypothetical protein OG705_29140 [Streptomyces sp. NBC_00838]|uniref:hypothetical protein n=1 Tax=Streptomyces sp. NBC_00838 TaxID=2903680 RepID=UPI00386EF19F|nr:hypothetical protein OG705_29140 [Streptomyces sp. NBC_00838]